MIYSLYRQSPAVLLGPQLTDELLAAAVLVHLRHVPVPGLHVQTTSLNISLHPLEAFKITEAGLGLCCPLAPVPVVSAIFAGGVIIMLPRTGIPRQVTMLL